MRDPREGRVGHATNQLRAVKDFVDTGDRRIVIDGTDPLAETAEAHRYVETG